jgi:hypothetical protein
MGGGAKNGHGDSAEICPRLVVLVSGLNSCDIAWIATDWASGRPGPSTVRNRPSLAAKSSPLIASIDIWRDKRG